MRGGLEEGPREDDSRDRGGDAPEGRGPSGEPYASNQTHAPERDRVRARRLARAAWVAATSVAVLSATALLISAGGSSLAAFVAAGLLLASGLALGRRWPDGKSDLHVPIARLAAAVREVEAGHYDLGNACRVRDSDVELRHLARGIEHLARTLRERDGGHHKVLESLRRMNEIRDQVLSSISHELRTPTTSIVAYAELLTAQDLAPDARDEFVSVLHRESRRLAHVIDSVLDWTVYAGGAGSAERVPVRLEELVASVVADIAHVGGDARVRFELRDFDAVELTVDPGRTRKALRCLMENAARFSPEGGAVRVVFEPSAANAPAGLRVEDDGPGIPDDVRALVFDLFQQGGDILEDKPAGLGLGLPLARVCMRAQGGDVEVTRSDRTGSVFRLVFPPDAVITRARPLRRVVARRVVTGARTPGA